MSERRLLWVGDAACESGFGRATHYTLDVLRRFWDVHVIGINYRGEPHSYPYNIHPAFIGGDLFGIGRIRELCGTLKPDVVVLQNDPWNIPGYTEQLKSQHFVGSIAVDGLNCKGDLLNGLSLAIFWTEFAREEAIRGGLKQPSAVIPLGVDLEIYNPGDRVEARRTLGINEQTVGPNFDKAFIVGNVNRNQPRKRLDLTIRYFARWVKQYRADDAYLFLHVAPTGDDGYDCEQLAVYYGINKRLILAEPEVFKAPPEERLANTYRCFDVQVSTSQGEGWGLTTMEGMACGIPQIVPTWSALGEWCGDAALQVPCSNVITTPGRINSIGGLVDEEPFIRALQSTYVDPSLLERLTHRGLSLVQQPQYRWESIGLKFAEEITRHIYKEAPSGERKLSLVTV
jgi:D-inositol-3-phosphate glycosyltransferase